MDGTLSKPQTWMFGLMRQALGIEGQKIDILAQLESLQGDERIKAEKAIENIELKAMNEMAPQEGLSELFEYLSENEINKTICTRNLIKPVNHLLSKFLPTANLNEPIVTRLFDPPKPSPKPILHISSQWGIPIDNMIMVGDSRDDMFAGINAGCSVILLRHKDNGHIADEIPEIDCVVDSLDEIIDILNNGFIKKEKILKDTTSHVGY
ncbi:hypothetical protein B5S30_g5019 [[Candida] boidinii]|nr:hypothetical protein B5S30_g5019 [[Candida] boidinii]